MTISFECTLAEDAIIQKIARRARALETSSGGKARTQMDWVMDVVATHANGNPLRLQELLDADDFNFAHDVFGICRHLDRDDGSPTAGQLTGGFSPRFSTPVREAA